MKKTLIIVTMLFIALGALGVGIVEAQGSDPPFGQRGVADGTGSMHEYMEKAMAEVVGLTVDEFEARHNVGETFYQIALALLLVAFAVRFARGSLEDSAGRHWPRAASAIVLGTAALALNHYGLSGSGTPPEALPVRRPP